MDRHQQAKSGIESFHLDWLCAHFRVYRPEQAYRIIPELKDTVARLRVRPDLIATTDPPTLLELKSRSYQGKENRKRTYWWSCMASQLNGYDEAVDQYGLAHAWLFLLVESDQNLALLATTSQIEEHNIRNRELFIAPHGIERVASNNTHPSKYYNISAPRLETERFSKIEPYPALDQLLHPDLESTLIDCFMYK